MLLIAWFMMRISAYGLVRTALSSIGILLITFVVFVRWVLVALPKVPIDRMLGH